MYFVETFPNKKRAILIHGPPGCGKTAAVYALAYEKDYEVVELNSSDFRNSENIKNVMGAASKQASLFKSKKVILIDELDGISGTADKGGVQSIIKIIKETSFPIILIVNDLWNTKFRTLRLYCELTEFATLQSSDIVQRLKKICQVEGIKHEDISLSKLAAASNGDLRAAINDLQLIASENKEVNRESVAAGGRDYEEKVFNALRLIFKSFDSKTALRAVDDLPMEPQQFIYWLDQNIPMEYRLPNEIQKAYKALCDADIFRFRISRYVNYFLSAGVQQAKEQARGGFSTYSRPETLQKIFIRAAKNRKSKNIAASLSSEFHASAKTIQQSFLPYFDYIREVNPEMGKDVDALLEGK